ncbi:MAG: hypothetical protein A3J37_04080 [Alphaproteobacteria bacterium RIFCSPHIGHO2_12_FULL_45_9]|nr:MAG: hypothetical protein A3J37_04080 [Alphaproteobacteria bacterium RIFCSPHIGHO2_12_FULL_45_9]
MAVVEKITEDLYAYLRENWFKKTGLMSAVLLAVILQYTLLNTNNQPLNLFLVSIYMIALPILWGHSQKRVKKGKLGIGIALTYENNDECKKLYHDLVTAIQSSFALHELKDVVIVRFDNIQSSTIVTFPEALDACKDKNLRVLLFGKVRVRKLKNDDEGLIEIKCAAQHVPIPLNHSQQFGNIIKNALADRMHLPVNEFILTEIAAKHTEAVIKYIIGLTCCFANDYKNGERFLVEAKEQAEVTQPHVSYEKTSANGTEQRIFSFYNTIKSQLSHLYSKIIADNLNLWRATNDVRYLTESQAFVEKLKNLQTQNEAEHDLTAVSAAIGAFVLHRDIDRAYRELEKCKNKNQSWFCNIAFLKAYEGNLDAAYKNYMSAFRLQLTDPTTFSQCEEFIVKIIEDEPEKRAELYFCLGVINYRAKGDYYAAKRDFIQFLKRASDQKHTKHIGLVQKWLEDIELRRRGNKAS